MKYFNIIKDWLDPRYNLITQPPPYYDGGDTAQRCGMYAVGIELLYRLGKCDDQEYEFTKTRYEEVLQRLSDPWNPGFIRRYPDAYYWGGQSDRLSRDQAIPNVVAMGFMNRKRLSAFFWGHLKSRALLFMTNTRNNWAWPPGHPEYNEKDYKWKLPDVTLFSFWALYVRAYKNRLLYPLLCVFDVELLGSVLAKCFLYGRDKTKNDDLNLQIELLQSKVVMPTPLSMLAMLIYRKCRPYPANPGTATNRAQACLHAYFKNPGNPGPKLDEVYQEITEHYFEDKIWLKKK